MAIPKTIGVVGAGTMGAGIAQLAAQAGARTLLHDPVPQALERGLATVAAGLDRQVARGRLSAADAAAIRARVEPAASLEQLAPCGLVIEAAPERLDLKLDLFERLAEIAGPDCVLATNTSSLSVAEIAAGVPHPERVVGLHFFNPAPVMRLAEVVPGVATAPEVVAAARAARRGDGQARDRCGRHRRLPRQPRQPPVLPRRRCGSSRTARRPSSRSTASCGWPAASAWARSS